MLRVICPYQKAALRELSRHRNGSTRPSYQRGWRRPQFLDFRSTCKGRACVGINDGIFDVIIDEPFQIVAVFAGDILEVLVNPDKIRSQQRRLRQ